MVDRNTALKLLRVNEGASKDLLIQAYHKMVRRYPPEFFPERALQIDAAYQRLIYSSEYWHSFLNEEYQQQEWFQEMLEMDSEIEIKIKSDNSSPFASSSSRPSPSLSAGKVATFWLKILK